MRTKGICYDTGFLDGTGLHGGGTRGVGVARHSPSPPSSR